MSSTWTCEDDILNDVLLLSYGNIKPGMKHDTSATLKEILVSKDNHTVHKSIYQDDIEINVKEVIKPGRGRYIATKIRPSSFEAPIFAKHLQDTKDSIRQVSPYNFSNEHIEKYLSSGSVKQNELQKDFESKVNIGFKPLLKIKETEEPIEIKENEEPIEIIDEVVEEKQENVAKPNKIPKKYYYNKNSNKRWHKSKTNDRS